METYRGVVYPHHHDHMGHMNVQWYTAKFDEATWHLFSAGGITAAYVRDTNRGMAALEQVTKYKAEAFAGDLLIIKSKMLEVNNKTLRFLHTMYNAETGAELATSELVGAHLDREKRKACPFPDDIRAKCEALLAETA